MNLMKQIWLFRRRRSPWRFVARLLITAASVFMLSGCTYVKIARMEGVVRDARSKAPITNAVVGGGWGGTGFGIGHYRGVGFGSETTVSDKAGRYVLQAQHFFVTFLEDLGGGSFGAFHPLYVKYGWDWLWSSNPKQENGYLWNLAKYGKDGVIYYDIELQSIEERYSKPEDLNKFDGKLAAEVPTYLRSLKEKQGIRYDIQEIMDVYQRVHDKLKQGTELRSMTKFKNEINQLIRDGY